MLELGQQDLLEGRIAILPVASIDGTEPLGGIGNEIGNALGSFLTLLGNFLCEISAGDSTSPLR